MPYPYVNDNFGWRCAVLIFIAFAIDMQIICIVDWRWNRISYAKYIEKCLNFFIDDSENIYRDVSSIVLQCFDPNPISILSVWNWRRLICTLNIARKHTHTRVRLIGVLSELSINIEKYSAWAANRSPRCQLFLRQKFLDGIVHIVCSKSVRPERRHGFESVSNYWW